MQKTHSLSVGCISNAQGVLFYFRRYYFTLYSTLLKCFILTVFQLLFRCGERISAPSPAPLRLEYHSNL